MPQTATVGLNANLDEPITLFLAHGLETECARICVGTYHGYRISWLITRRQISSRMDKGIFVQTHTFHLWPIANARIVVALRVRKYLPPGTHCLAQGVFSLIYDLAGMCSVICVVRLPLDAQILLSRASV